MVPSHSHPSSTNHACQLPVAINSTSKCPLLCSKSVLKNISVPYFHNFPQYCPPIECPMIPKLSVLPNNAEGIRHSKWLRDWSSCEHILYRGISPCQSHALRKSLKHVLSPYHVLIRQSTVVMQIQYYNTKQEFPHRDKKEICILSLPLSKGHAHVRHDSLRKTA